MRFIRPTLALVLSLLILLNTAPRASACGPSNIEPVFVFHESPDLPFSEFTRGKIGIVQPTFGRKTLVIAYRYLNGGAFTSDEQEALAEALRGKGPEDESNEPVKQWIALRKEFMSEGEKLPEIYTEREREYRSYDFFPNCAKNAFEVAAATLKDRAQRFGADDRNVHAWIAAQDSVFQNCAGGGTIPEPLGPESPLWLRKDRDYQIAASLFYSLNFDEARARFEKIATDNESDWQQTADYLVARTLVRQASLTQDEKRQRELYEQAEIHLQVLLSRGGKFYSASQKLLALVKYRAHPEERVQELGRILTSQGGNENLRQDLIDYVWLLDKFEAQVRKEEAKRKKALKGEKEESSHQNPNQEKWQAVQRGELIEIIFYSKQGDKVPDYANSFLGFFQPDTSEAEILQAVEDKFGRKLTVEEINELKTRHKAALAARDFLLAPNRKWGSMGATDYEGGCYDACGEALDLTLLPEFLRAEELSDWIFAFQLNDPESYAHALSKWRETQSPAWLIAVLAKTEKDSPGVQHLMREAQKISQDSPAYPTVSYHLVRLQISLRRKAEARKLLDEIISNQPENLPISAQNQFREQRMQLSESLSEFFKFAQRRPVVFYYEGSYGTIRELVDIQKRWDETAQAIEENEREIEEHYKDVLPWNDRFIFDDKTADILNWHFPLTTLVQAMHDPALPDYLQGRLALVVWTRAILLDKDEVALSVAPEVAKAAPEMEAVFTSYLKARSATARKHAALFVLLKFPVLSPFIAAGLQNSSNAEEMNYYFETAWWCAPSDKEYNDEGNEVPKVVPRPAWLTANQLESARREHIALVEIGDAKSYLGAQAIEWAKTSPNDPRIPEALFIAAKANESYKYGCNGWEADKDTREEAETMLRERYPRSPWTAKLKAPNN